MPRLRYLPTGPPFLERDLETLRRRIDNLDYSGFSGFVNPPVIVDNLEVRARGLGAMHQLSDQLRSEESWFDTVFGTTVGREVRNTALMTLEEDQNSSRTAIARRNLSLAKEKHEYEREIEEYQEERENKKKLPILEIKREVMRLNQTEYSWDCPFGGPKKVIRVTCSAHRIYEGFEATVYYQCKLASAITDGLEMSHREEILQRHGCPTRLYNFTQRSPYNGCVVNKSQFGCQFATGLNDKAKSYKVC